MKKLLCVSLMVFAFVPAAFAQTRIGVGWDNGYSVVMNAEQFSLQLTGDFGSVIPEDDNADTETEAEIAVYGAYPFLGSDEAKLAVFGGFALIPSTEETTVGSVTYDKELDFAVRFGLQPQTMLTDNLGLSAKIGLEVGVDQGYEDLDDSGSTTVGAWGGVGVHWFF